MVGTLSAAIAADKVPVVSSLVTEVIEVTELTLIGAVIGI